jgi:hypothetical protein
MDHHELKYSAKVWLAGLLIGPAIAAVVSYCVEGSDGGVPIYIILMIPPFICIPALFSCLTWIIFWGLINVVIHFVPEPFLQKFWIMLVGITLTLATFCPFFTDNFSIKNGLFPLVVGYTVGITFGVWYCNLSKHLANELSKDIQIETNP